MGLEAEIEALKRQNHRLKLAMCSIIVVVVAVAGFAGVVATRARVQEQRARVMAEQARAEVFGNAEEAAIEGVVGMITLDGQPVENVTVEFVPDDGGRSSAGRTNANGQFELEKIVTPGNYKVTIKPEQSSTTVERPQKKADIGKSSGGDEIELGAGR